MLVGQLMALDLSLLQIANKFTEFATGRVVPGGFFEAGDFLDNHGT